MTAADGPPDRAHLAARLRVFAVSAAFFGHDAKVGLLTYINVCEDTIEAQASMLRADLTELVSHRRSRAEDAETNDALRREFYALKRDNAELHTLALAALSAAGVCGPDAAETIRRALEKTQ